MYVPFISSVHMQKRSIFPSDMESIALNVFFLKILPSRVLLSQVSLSLCLWIIFDIPWHAYRVYFRLHGKVWLFGPQSGGLQRTLSFHSRHTSEHLCVAEVSIFIYSRLSDPQHHLQQLPPPLLHIRPWMTAVFIEFHPGKKKKKERLLQTSMTKT